MFYFLNSRSSYTIVSIILFCFIFSLSSCTTTKTYTIQEPKTINDDVGVIKIEEVITKDSTSLSFKENDAVYKKKYKDNKEVIIYNSGKVLTDSITKKIYPVKSLLLLKDISSIKYNKTYSYIPKPVITTLIVTAAALTFIYFLFLKDFRFG